MSQYASSSCVGVHGKTHKCRLMEVCLSSCELQMLTVLQVIIDLFHAQYLYNNIKTPLFVLNSQYDTAQLSGLYKLPCLPPKNCSTEDMKLLQHFNQVFMEKLQPVLASTSNGYFIDSCLIHTQAHADKSWTMITAQGHPLRESFADWYYERPSSEGATRVVDCKYPCNPTCPARSELQNSMLFL